MSFKLALLLHKTYNKETVSSEWIDLFFNQTFNSRETKANFIDLSNYKIGTNVLSNRFKILNGKISFHMLNNSYESYKIECKTIFILMSILLKLMQMAQIEKAKRLPKYKAEV